MSEPEVDTEKQTKNRWGCGCFGLLLLVVGYILSPGPIILVYEKFPESVQTMLEPALEIFYLPLEWCCEKFEHVESFYNWYLEFIGVY